MDNVSKIVDSPMQFVVTHRTNPIVFIDFLDATREHRDRSEAVIITQDVNYPRDVSCAVRTQFEEFDHKNSGMFHLTASDTNEFYPPSELPQETRVQV